MVHTLPDLVGNSGTQKISNSATRVPANWIQFTVPLNATATATTNTATVRVGDKSVTSSQGVQVTIYGTLFPSTSDSTMLDLTQIYFFATTGDKLQVTYGVI